MGGTAVAAVKTFPPVVKTGTGNPEALKYGKLWGMSEYRQYAPGEAIAPMFLEKVAPAKGSTVIDFGCGTGRGSAFLATVGGLKVTLLDFVNNSLDEDVRSMVDNPDFAMQFMKVDLEKSIPVLAEYGYCFTKDTKVSLMNGGEVSFEDLVKNYADKPFWVYSYSKKRGEVVPGLAHSPRITQKKAQLVKVALDNGESIRCTPQHRFMLRDGSYKAAKDLSVSDSLMPLYRTREVMYGKTDYERIHSGGKSFWTHQMSSKFAKRNKSCKICGENLSSASHGIRHHRDFNRFNNSSDNIQFVTWKEHYSLHSDHISRLVHDPESGVGLQHQWNNPAFRKKMIRLNSERDYSHGKNAFSHMWKNPDNRANIIKQLRSRNADPNSSCGFANLHKDGVFHKKAVKAASKTARKLLASSTSNFGFANLYNSGVIIRKADPKQISFRMKNGGALKANHVRHHVNRNVSNSDCNYCAPANHKVVSVEHDGFEDVYDLTVEKYHNFALTAGVFVHNCTDVMEHIPENKVQVVLDNILKAARNVWFSICLVDDVCGKMIGEHLHLTVKSFDWWTEQFRLRDCNIIWSHDDSYYAHFYVSAWQDGQVVVDGGELNTGAEKIRENVRANCEGLRWMQVSPHDENDIDVMIIGGGPSLNDHLDEIIKLRAEGVKLITLNGSYNWALHHKLIPSAQVVVDARPFNIRFTRPVVDDCKYLIGSQCDPSILEGLPEDRTYLWHTTSANIEDILKETYGVYWPILGGSTVMLRAIPLLRLLGYKRFHLFGCDSCLSFSDKSAEGGPPKSGSSYVHHAYSQPENDSNIVVPVVVKTPIHGGFERIFYCHIWMIAQAQEFISMIRYIGTHMEIQVHGDGLLKYILDAGAEAADGLNLKNIELV